MNAVIADRGALGRMAATLGKNIDYSALAAKFGDSSYVRHIFASAKEPGVEQGIVIPMLEKAGWTVHAFDPMPGPDGRPRAYPEVNMAICALQLSDEIETVTLCTGANAAAPIARALVEAGIHVRIASFKNSLGGELRRAASCLPNGELDIVYLDSLDVFLPGK